MDEITEGGAGAPCPRCRAPLGHIERGGHVLEVCPSCRGTWFDAGELTPFAQVYRRLPPDAGEPTGIACVRCGTALRVLDFPGTTVQIDRCPACQGTWLDGGELELLRGQLEHVVAASPEAREAEQTRALAIVAEVEQLAAKRMGCPACKASLWHLRRDGQLVEMCSACGGLWLDAGELTVLVQVYRPLDATGGRASTRACLRCETALSTVPWPGTSVEVDVCAACGGAWLDKGKLEALRATVASLVGPEVPLQERAQTLIIDAAEAQARRPGCPGCDGELAAAALGEAGDVVAPGEGGSGRGGVERCAGCSSAWLDSGLLTLALGVSRKVRLSGAAATSRRCVRCPAQALVRLDYPGTSVGIDVCPDCRGTWLPPGALVALRAAVHA